MITKWFLNVQIFITEQQQEIQMNVRQLMMQYFETPAIQSRLINYINKKELDIQTITDGELMTMMEDLQLLNPLSQEIESVSHNKILPLDMFQIQNNRKQVKITVKSGRKFIFQKFSSRHKFFISVSGLNQRARTTSYQIAQQFILNQTMVLKVDPNLITTSNSSPIELVVVVFGANGHKQIHAIKNVQWRYILCSGTTEFQIQLAAYNYQGKMQVPCVGVLSLKIQIFPFSQIQKVSERLINNQFTLERKNYEINHKKFYQNANNFWNDYKMIHKSFQSRKIRVYAESQDKIYVPACRLICPLYNVRGIESPFHALRFCSLINFQQEGLQRKNIHKRFHSMLASCQGSVDDHCHLLCSLLLGFGLKAYVCVGFSLNGDHTWVITLEKNTVTFWQCAKGIKYDFYSPQTHKLYHKVHCLYNHEQFYANSQLDDSIASTSFKFSDSTAWKRLDPKFIQPLPPYNSPMTLLPPTFDIFQIQQDTQIRICKELSQFRKQNKLNFVRDEILGSILSTALSNYEMERVTGNTFCMQEFQTAIKNYIPIKHTFKAFPIQLTTLDPSEIMDTLKNQPKCREIMLSKGDDLYFAIKAKLILFPENLFALWLSIAVRFYKIN